MNKGKKLGESSIWWQQVGFMLALIGLFIFVHSIRNQLLFPIGQRSYLWNINFFAISGLLCVVVGKGITINRNNVAFISCVLALLFLQIKFFVDFEIPLGESIVSICCLSVPLFLLYIELNETIRQKLLRFAMIVLDVIFVVLVIWAFIDTLSNRLIMRWVANFMTVSPQFEQFAYPTNTETNRFFSFFGHPLNNAGLFNILYILNISWNEKEYAIIPSWLCCILAICGVVCCGSKTGTVVAVLITMISFFKNIKVLAIMGISGFVVLCTGAADNLIIRFTNGSLTTGRASSLQSFFGEGDNVLYFLRGHNDDVMNAALEFVFINTAYCWGILFSILFMIAIGGYTSWVLLKRKAIKTWLVWALYYAEMNTFYALGMSMGDGTWIVCFLTMLLINIELCDNGITLATNKDCLTI